MDSEYRASADGQSRILETRGGKTADWSTYQTWVACKSILSVKNGSKAVLLAIYSAAILLVYSFKFTSTAE